jgi:hypothetical protein
MTFAGQSSSMVLVCLCHTVALGQKVKSKHHTLFSAHNRALSERGTLILALLVLPFGENLAHRKLFAIHLMRNFWPSVTSAAKVARKTHCFFSAARQKSERLIHNWPLSFDFLAMSEKSCRNEKRWGRRRRRRPLLTCCLFAPFSPTPHLWIM